MAILCGVKNEFSIARAPRHGVLTISDNRGRVVAEKSTAGAALTTILGPVPVPQEVTLYSRFGDWFAWCFVGLVLALLVFV
jgi:apolipoprotein N-acyltransferase